MTRPFKGILHPKMKILSSFTHPQVVANLYEFLSSAEHKGRYFDWNFGTIDFFSTMKVNGPKQLFGSNRSSKYFPLCSAERNSYRFATT